MRIHADPDPNFQIHVSQQADGGEVGGGGGGGGGIKIKR
jgi:hypothetical protein